jgi:carotenoid cleavage dioxygenase-like enzyme
MIHPDTLETLGMYDVGPFNGFIGSHPRNGVFMRLEYHLNMKTTLHFIDTNDGYVSWIECNYSHFLYAHDFIVSEKYFVVFDHALDVDMMPGAAGIGKRIRPTGGMQKILLINRMSGELAATIPFFHPDCAFATHHISITEDTRKRRIVISTIYYPGFMTPPGKIVSITICTKTMKVVDIKEVRKWAEFPVGSNMQYLTTFAGIARFDPQYNGLDELTIYERDDYVYSEVCVDNNTGYGLCYAWNNTKKHTTLKIMDLVSSNLIAELAFPTADGYAPLGLHGFFAPKS